MEKNIVLLELPRYEQLIEIEKEYTKESVMVKTYRECGDYKSVYYYTSDEAFKDISKKTEEHRERLEKEVSKLQIKIDLMERENKLQTISYNNFIDDMREMSIWQFIKWRKS